MNDDVGFRLEKLAVLLRTYLVSGLRQKQGKNEFQRTVNQSYHTLQTCLDDPASLRSLDRE